jgi:hypothetical protein
MSVHSAEKNVIEEMSDEIDLSSFHEQHAGRLVVDPGYVQARSAWHPVGLAFSGRRKLNSARPSRPNSS